MAEIRARQRMDERQSRMLGWLAAVGVHGLLLLLFALWNVGWRYEIPEWVEMEFLSLNPQPARETESAPPAPPPQDAVKHEERVIHLPKRRMLEEEVPRLPVRREKEIPEREPSTEVVRRYERGREPSPEVVRSPRRAQGKALADLGKLNLGGREAKLPAPDLGKGVAVPFLIEGEAAERTVVHRVIPQYPSGLAREAVVKISFTVLPSGVIARAAPILKGDATLEKIALEAFRQWRFNPLPPDIEQKEQQGVITFRFVLK